MLSQFEAFEMIIPPVFPRQTLFRRRSLNVDWQLAETISFLAQKSPCNLKRRRVVAGLGRRWQLAAGLPPRHGLIGGQALVRHSSKPLV
jgi:hypothetical protein